VEAYAGLAAQLSRQEKRTGLAWQAMLAVEQAREASFSPRADRTLAEDPDYQETLASWRAQQFWRFGEGGARHLGDQKSKAIESKLRSMENGWKRVRHAEPVLDGKLGLERLQSNLGPKDALLSFSLGEGGSWLWAMTRNSFEQVPLPARGELVHRLAGFGKSIHYDSPDQDGPARELCATLFDGLSSNVRSRTRWLLSVDDALLEAPLSALRCKSGAGERYLIQEHELTPIISALSLVEKQGARPQLQLFLGIGDPVYNLADDRWAAATKESARKLATTQLPRLPGTREELQRIAAGWAGAGLKYKVLTGFEATPERFSQEVASSPGVIHLAVHLVQEVPDSQGVVLMRSGAQGMSAVRARRPSEMFLMFSMRPDGQSDGLTARSVDAYRLPGSLVVMSGCGTGLGTHQPGAGLAGFFRSWIAAGASGVVGTLWSIPDDASALFGVFYESIRAGKAPSMALRDAQLALLSQGGWNSRPSFWSAWTTVRRN